MVAPMICALPGSLPGEAGLLSLSSVGVVCNKPAAQAPSCYVVVCGISSKVTWLLFPKFAGASAMAAQCAQACRLAAFAVALIYSNVERRGSGKRGLDFMTVLALEIAWLLVMAEVEAVSGDLSRTSRARVAGCLAIL